MPQGELICHRLLLLEAPVLFLLIPANPCSPPHACHSHHPALITCALMCLLWSPEFVKTIFTNTAQPFDKYDFLIMIFAIRPLEIFGLNKIRLKPSPKRVKQTCWVRNGDISPQVSSVQQHQRGFYRFFFFLTCLSGRSVASPCRCPVVKDSSAPFFNLWVTSHHKCLVSTGGIAALLRTGDLWSKKLPRRVSAMEKKGGWGP